MTASAGSSRSPTSRRAAMMRRLRPFSGTAIEPTGRPLAVICRCSPIVLVENNMVARAIHGMIALGGWFEEVRK